MEKKRQSLASRLYDFVHLEKSGSYKLLLYPGVIVMLLLTVVPTVFALVISLQNYNLAAPWDRGFVFLDNYLNVLKDPRFWTALKNTAIFTFFGLLVEVGLGMVLALMLNKKVYGGGFVKSAFLIPMISTPVVVGLVWKMFYDPQFGMINFFLGKLGINPIDWLGNPKLALPSVIFVDVWEWTPFVLLILFSALRSLPQDPYEAAIVDGASPFQTFRYITLPMLTPAITVAVVFRFIDLFKWMDTIYVMTAGGPGMATETLSMYAYLNAFKLLDMGKATAICVLILVFVSQIGSRVGKRIFAER